MQISVDIFLFGYNTQYCCANLGFFIYVFIWGNKRRMTKNYSGKSGVAVCAVEQEENNIL